MKREPWHDNFIKSLAILADIPLQERIWIDGDYTVFVESPSELICRVFDDSAILDLMKSGIVFSDEADKIFREMDSLSDKINLEQKPEKFLNDPKWIQLSLLAKDAINAVEKVLSEDS